MVRNDQRAINYVIKSESRLRRTVPQSGYIKYSACYLTLGVTQASGLSLRELIFFYTEPALLYLELA
jgi:hypothetical protein